MCASEGSANSLYVLLSGLVDEILDAPFCRAKVSSELVLQTLDANVSIYQAQHLSQAPWRTSWRPTIKDTRKVQHLELDSGSSVKSQVRG